MRNRIAMAAAFTMCVLAIVVPTTAALYVAHRQSVQSASEQAASLVGGVLHRVDDMGVQANGAYQRLRQTDTPEPCSTAKRAQLRTVLMDYDYLQAVGYVSGSRITCSAVSSDFDNADIGSPSYTSALGTRVHLAVTIHGNRPSVVMEKNGFAAATHPEILLNASTNIPGLAQGIYGRSARQVWAHAGYFDPRWLTRLGDAASATFFDGQYLVVVQPSKSLDMAAYVAIPLAYLNSRLRSFVVILLPIGLGVGAALVVAVVFLVRQRISLPAILRGGLKRKEFVLYYQPIVELASGRLAGVEALLRWPANKQIGMRPALFIQAAEECGLIQRFTEYALERVALDGPRLFRAHPGVYISINLSSVDLRSVRVVEWLRRLIATPGIAPYNIVVELTEHSFVEPTRAGQTIEQIRAMGIRVAIDDFGTGFSSLSHLHNLSADYLKIDKVFVDAIGTDSVTSEVVLHIIEMARSLNLTLISEGVETRSQADFLRQRGVTFAQGWLFSKALPLAELLREYEAR
ncbi:EAL domain-containing protein [Rhodanobacter sp. AS-Z3]|uniref:EAL domain-containing protein n=1 Tax=Rhodanobacter sp. AS-Z3 TaxID=3031330 RepID=UPI00247AEC07|nr:EAL domain-containing protein [Rhodanobacter sp. AS-Z3]WEN15683.1 EAL domain-containing protein [Rhodanobacter sp. AS-Z3]